MISPPYRRLVLGRPAPPAGERQGLTHKGTARRSPSARAALTEISKPLGRRIADRDRDELIAAGLLEQVLGGLKLTPLGEGAAMLARDNLA